MIARALAVGIICAPFISAVLLGLGRAARGLHNAVHPAKEHAVITEADAQPHANTHVTLTLVDGTKVKGYISGVGYSGLRLMVKGQTTEWRFSSVAAIAPKGQR